MIFGTRVQLWDILYTSVADLILFLTDPDQDLNSNPDPNPD
jgi:hypothetical protein